LPAAQVLPDARKGACGARINCNRAPDVNPKLGVSCDPMFIQPQVGAAIGRRQAVKFRGTQALRVLALASQKGGSGKTTLSGHLAVQAQRAGAGPVVLIDIDPQGSLADWWNEREAEYPAFAQTAV